MAHIRIQLTIEGGPGQEQGGHLKRRPLLTIGELPCWVQGTSHGPQAKREAWFCLQEREDGIWLCPEAGADKVCINGKPVEGAHRLTIGERISCQGYEYGYYLQRERCRLALSSLWFARFAKGCSVLILILEILAMAALPVIFIRASLWNRAVASQRIFQQLEVLRMQISHAEVNTFVSRTILGEMEGELNERIRYVKANGNAMSRSQRRAMQEELSRMKIILDHLTSGASLPADSIRKPSLDEAVQRIIGE